MTKHPRRWLKKGSKSVLVVLFVPSKVQDGEADIDQDYWVDEALKMFGRVFGGATAYPKAKGIWRNDEMQGKLVEDEPVVFHCYTTHEDIHDDKKLDELGDFCRRMGRETNQGEVGLIIGNEYIAITDFSERREES